MARVAVRGRRLERLILMTGNARNTRMRSLQRKYRLVVIEAMPPHNRRYLMATLAVC